MTMPGRPSPGRGERAEARPLVRAVWSLRMLGLFLVGPIVGIGLVGAIFGLAPGLWWTAGIVFLLPLSLFAVLVHGEWRRLIDEAGR